MMTVFSNFYKTCTDAYDPEKAKQVTKTVASVALFRLLIKEKPYLTAFATGVGLAFPDASLEKTNQLWNQFYEFINCGDVDGLSEFLYKKALPAAGAISIGLFALPVVTYPAITAALGARFGALGFRFDLFFETGKQKKTGDLE